MDDELKEIIEKTDLIIKVGTAGSGSWSGPGQPRFPWKGKEEEDEGEKIKSKDMPDYVKRNFIHDTVRRKRAEFDIPAVNEYGDKVEGKRDKGSCSLYCGEVKGGASKNDVSKGKTAVYVSSNDFGIYMRGFISRESFKKIGKKVSIEELYKMGLDQF